METTACATSNIRLLRLKPSLPASRFSPYYAQLALDSAFHHSFWYENNRLFNALAPHEHAQFVLDRQQRFRAYHAECWRRNFRALGIGLKCLLPFGRLFKYSLKC